MEVLGAAQLSIGSHFESTDHVGGARTPTKSFPGAPAKQQAAAPALGSKNRDGQDHWLEFC